MWWDLVIDVVWPNGGARSGGRKVETRDRDKIAVEFRVPGAFKRRLNQSGWLEDEVIAAGVLRQGHEPSIFALVTGLALIELIRPRRSKSLPREFVLAVTAARVVAFALSLVKEGDGTTDLVVKIKRGERGSWPRELVRMIDSREGVESRGGTLELGGVERFPVASDGDDSTDELIKLLRR